MTTSMRDSFLVLLFRRNHMSTAKTLEIDFCRATDVHLPDQIVGNKRHCDGMRSRQPAKGPVLTGNTVQCDATLLATISTGRFLTGGQYYSHMILIAV